MALSLPERVVSEFETTLSVFPAGSWISIHVRSLNRSTNSFGLNASEFDPTRYLRATTTTNTLEVDVNKTSAVRRFGSSTRRCLGYKLADQILEEVLVTMAKRYELIERVPGEGAPGPKCTGLPFFASNSDFTQTHSGFNNVVTMMR